MEVDANVTRRVRDQIRNFGCRNQSSLEALTWRIQDPGMWPQIRLSVGLWGMIPAEYGGFTPGEVLGAKSPKKKDKNEVPRRLAVFRLR